MVLEPIAACPKVDLVGIMVYVPEYGDEPTVNPPTEEPDPVNDGQSFIANDFFNPKIIVEINIFIRNVFIISDLK